LLADTPFAEQVAQYQAHLEGILGKAIAEGVEGRDLEASYENDAYLLGGGGLIGTLLVGAVGSKAGKALDGNSSAVNHNPHSGRTDAEAGMPYDHPVKSGAKGATISSSEAVSNNAQAALRAKLSGLQKAQQTAAVTKTLPDGRIRYYTQEVPARTEGATRGASFVTEYNPATGSTRQWMESYDQSGAVIRVHPKSINGQPVSAQHYPPTGAELQGWE